MFCIYYCTNEDKDLAQVTSLLVGEVALYKLFKLIMAIEWHHNIGSRFPYKTQ